MAVYRLKRFSNPKGEVQKKPLTPGPTGPLPKLPAPPKPPSLVAMQNLQLRLAGLAIALLNLQLRMQNLLRRDMANSIRAAQLELKRKHDSTKGIMLARAVEKAANQRNSGVFRKLTTTITPRSIKR